MIKYVMGTLAEPSYPGKRARLITHEGIEEIVCHNFVKNLPMTIDAGLNVVAFEDTSAGQWEIVQAECPA